MMTTDTIESQIRNVLAEHGRLNKDAQQLGPEDDLYQAGLTSHASVNLMLALEAMFDVEFPDHLLNRSVFSSIESIRGALAELNVG
jgi:acyl carrier protein